ncbi:MAG: hypothetical protein U9O94_07035 [Nanoarchaeota archaeon]|nr:hypothetical protein [Nanoarchaeota archaeon]
MNESNIKEIFNRHTDLTYDVGDEGIEDIPVMSYECFLEAVNDLLSERQTTTEAKQDHDTKTLRIADVSNRFSPEQMAEWFHNNYEEIAKAEGWQTQDKCKVEFKDLPKSNQATMIKVCERWLNGC